MRAEARKVQDLSVGPVLSLSNEALMGHIKKYKLWKGLNYCSGAKYCLNLLISLPPMEVITLIRY